MEATGAQSNRNGNILLAWDRWRRLGVGGWGVQPGTCLGPAGGPYNVGLVARGTGGGAGGGGGLLDTPQD